METPQNEPVFTPVELDERDQVAVEAVGTLQQEEQAESAEQTEPAKDAKQEAKCIDFSAKQSRILLSESLGAVQATVSLVFGVPFKIEPEAEKEWLDRATPMLEKYGPLGESWFKNHVEEFAFIMATYTLVGGCAVQVRHLRVEKARLEAKQAAEEQRQEEADEITVTSEQEQPPSA
ncbi:hypothetical protein [Vibrio coralliilyticus]|uniref:hypothetical protein n=1 Tax=Vibrio coralliilyticus TaxID=190893 RepID=UPI002409BE6C|nr:hypothetical protein [Vibrio coralliilyticus]WFB47859.1 hypothetical protein P6988_01150 [Vibrio coralliilyticus]